MLKLSKVQMQAYKLLKQGAEVDCKPATLKALQAKGVIGEYHQSRTEFLGDFVIRYFKAEIII